MSDDGILALERLGLALWPPEERAPLDGWELTWSCGATRRTRSVHPFAAGQLALDDKLERCRRLYAARGGQALLKLTSAVAHAALDRALAERGWAREGETAVLVLERLDAFRPACDPSVSLSASPGEEWSRECTRLNEVRPHNRGALLGIQGRVPRPRAFASVARRGGGHAAQGLACVAREGRWLFVAEIVTESEARRRGLARRVVESLLAWGGEQGAERAFLQVVVGNRPAEALYARLGFRERYRYAYRRAKVEAR